MYFQHGDVLLKKIGKCNFGKKINTNIVHQGLNHTHNIEGDFELYDNNIIVTNNDCKLNHHEHGELVLPIGIYEKSIVKEYDHFLEESREVID